LNRTLPVLALLCAAVNCHAASPARPTSKEPVTEMRGLWVARWSLSSPQAIRNVVSAAKLHHFNTLFVQVRGRGDAYYQSDLEPRAEALSDQPASFDPLKSVVAEGHKSGLKVHAWLDTYLVWTGANRPKSPEHVLNAHPDWIARDRDNKFTTLPSEQIEGAFLQASNPAVQNHLYNVFTDVAKRYDVDGIHFDFVRYSCSAYDFSDGALARFASYIKPKLTERGLAAVKADRSRVAYVHAFPSEWAAWRREQVTHMVQRISEGVHTLKPWVEVSAAVFANADDALTERGQDWPTWLRNGYLDAVCPMAYSKNTEVVAKQIQYAVKVANGRHVYAGIGSWRLPVEDTAKKVAAVRALGAQGVTLFSYDGVTKDGRSMSYLDSLTRSTFASRAGFPNMRWRAERTGQTKNNKEDDTQR
jgi:uncharacterized lipoprotein YddW (UPF0748 family)